MASPYLYQFTSSPSPGVIQVFAHAVVGSDGYVSSTSEGAGTTLPMKSITSFTHDGATAGLFHLVLADAYKEVLWVHAVVVKSTAVAGDFKPVLLNQTAGKIDLQFQSAGSNASLASADILLMLVLKDLDV